MTHAEHTKSTEFFRCEKNNWRETTWHLGVESDFNPCLDFILTFNKQIKQRFSVHHRFSEVSHKTNQCGVPLVCNLGKSCGSAGHQNLTNSVFKLFNSFLVHLDKGLGGNFFGTFILKLPNSIFL